MTEQRDVQSFSVIAEELKGSVFGSTINCTNDFQNSYTYDRLNRQTQIVQQANGGYAVAYKKTVLSYDAGSRMTSLADYKDSATQVVSGSYGYDAVNRLTSLTWYGMGGPFNSAGVTIPAATAATSSRCRGATT